MSGDYSRQRFDPRKHFSGVLMEQGRVLIDAEWNEQVEINDRRWRAETVDIIGRAVVPKETPDGFRIVAAANTVTIGRGRMYVHGLLAENPGKAPAEFDAVLAELRNTAPVPYAEQPYLIDATTVAPLPTGAGPHLAYLVVWQREVNSLQDAALVESAIGTETTSRLQTVWQARLLADVGTEVTCATPDDQIPGWLDIIRPSAGRLTTAAVGVSTPSDPCLIPPSGGYRGLENQLYRVEIHTGGTQAQATFKWSRDNATVSTAVTAIPALDQLKVVRTGRDSILRFNPGDWVEVTDDRREFAGQPGHMRKVLDVNEATQTILLTAPLPAGDFPTNAQGQTDPARHTRVVRWDQKGEVRAVNGTLLANLDAAGSTGVIPLPVATTSVILENGVQVTFSTNPAGGRFRTGDFWTFAARTADASVEVLTQAPPRGVHRHYARLSVVTFPDQATDCRVLWPPDTAEGGCDCTVCVTPVSHNTGALTIQKAIDSVSEFGGKVCLQPGTYNLGETPVRIQGARAVHLHGHGWTTRLVYLGAGPALVVDDSIEVTIDDLAILTSPRGEGPDQSSNGTCVALRQSAAATLARCALVQLAADAQRQRAGPAVALGGVLLKTVLRDNLVSAGTGIGALARQGDNTGPALFTAGLFVDDNVLGCTARGVSLEQFCLHAGATRFSGNTIHSCAEAGIVLTGFTTPNAPVPFPVPGTSTKNVALGTHIDVRGNTLSVLGHGIVVGTDETRICENDIAAAEDGRGGNGIELRTGLDTKGIDRCFVLGNRIVNVSGHGIALTGRVNSAMIKQNIIDGANTGGIAVDDEGRADDLTIENNQLFRIGPRQNQPDATVAGVRITATERAAIVGNTIRGVGQSAIQARSRVGILLLFSGDARVAGNEVTDIGPPESVGESIGIEALTLFGRLEVTGNGVRRSRGEPVQGATNWLALRIVEGADLRILGNVMVATMDGRVVGFHGNRARAILPTLSPVTIRGNGLEGWGGRMPVVEVGVSGPAIFSDNRCLLSPDTGTTAVVHLAARSLVVSANQVQRPGERDAMHLLVDPKRFTAVGNITFGNVRVVFSGSTSTLPAPWKDLNILAQP